VRLRLTPDTLTRPDPAFQDRDMGTATSPLEDSLRLWQSPKPFVPVLVIAHGRRTSPGHTGTGRGRRVYIAFSGEICQNRPQVLTVWGVLT